MLIASIEKIFSTLQKNNPSPTTELKFNSHFELLIAVILSAQSTDIGVNKATSVLFKIANTPESILQLGEKKLKEYIKTIGLYNNKARYIIDTCRILINKHNSVVPDDFETLQHLPGVGRKTANVILNTAFSQKTIAVDTHVFRVANRTGLAIGKTPLAVEKILLSNINTEFLQYAHHWLVLHGRYVCLSRRPRCSICILRDLCEYGKKI